MLTPELGHIHSTVSWACESRIVSGAGVAGHVSHACQRYITCQGQRKRDPNRRRNWPLAAGTHTLGSCRVLCGPFSHALGETAATLLARPERLLTALARLLALLQSHWRAAALPRRADSPHQLVFHRQRLRYLPLHGQRTLSCRRVVVSVHPSRHQISQMTAGPVELSVHQLPQSAKGTALTSILTLPTANLFLFLSLHRSGRRLEEEGEGGAR